MNTALLRLLPLLLLALPPPLRDYFSASHRHAGDGGGGRFGLDVYHPIILVPGLSCPDLEARLTEAYTPSLPRCGALMGSGWFPLYQNTSELVDHDYMPCFKEQMSLVYDPVLNDYRNQPGVETRVPNFGSAHGFTSKNDPDRNVRCLIRVREELEGLGYRDRETLFGAPYDIRHAPPPSGQPSKVYSDYFARFRELVQHASEKNQNKPVILFGHSFGGRLALEFLNSTPLPWRKKFIRHLLLVSPTAPTGFMQVVSNLASGPAVLQVPTVPPLALRSMWTTFASSLLSLPSPKVFGHKPLVITKHKNYSAYDMVDFLIDLGFSANGIVAFTKRVLPTMLSVEAPMVPTTYISGVGVQTPEQLVYWKGNFDVAPDIVYGDGDSNINSVSVFAFEKELRRQQRQNKVHFKFVPIANATHSGIVTQQQSLSRVMAEILEANR